MICGNCGGENEPGAKFCKECGSRLASGCPVCGKANAPDAKFCSECGTPLQTLASGSDPARRTPTLAPASPAAPGAPATPVAERRLVTVLFADLVGFTPFAEGRDAEEVREALSRYFDLARDVIERYGGTVEKFIGDAVMAVWGAPIAREDDAERAVRAALDLVGAVRSVGPSIQARAGVLSGEAAVTVGAVGQGIVAGDLVNTASRLQSAAPPGSVLVGEATRRAAEGAIAFEPAGDQVLKGKSSPVQAWRALRVVAERGGRNRSEALEAPFVGREDELRLLKELFHATSREKRARLVSVIGPAGIGKTRLAWEFLKYLDGLVETAWYHHGRSPAYGDGITFWALGEMVRRRTGLNQTDDEETTRAKVADVLETNVPDLEERRWIEGSLLALLGFESSVATEELFGAWRTFFERLAASAPVVMVFEDFHYADSGLVDFVDHLMEWSRSAPICVITLARPEFLDRRPEWGAGKRNFTSLYLEPLSGPAMRELLAGLVPGLPEPTLRSIVGRADGVPLYAVETVRMLVAEGRLELRDGRYVPVGDLTTLAIPETLTALIASRLDGLAPADRVLVSDAAVLGQNFTVAGLSAVSGIGPAELEPRLRTLVRRELLTLQADPRSPERGQYAFVQALIREVAYNTLARADRKARHIAAARFFESLVTEELAGALAGHYLAAYTNSADGPERDALAAQARVALRGAAERARALGAHDQAVVFLQQAVSVTTDPGDRAELLERAGDSAANAAHFGQSEAFLTEAIALHREQGDAKAAAHAIAALGSSLINARRLEEALAVLEPAAAEFGDLFPDPGVVAIEGQRSRAHYLKGDVGTALEIGERVLEAAERADLLEILADTLVTRGSALADLGRVREGIGVVEIGERIARSEGFNRALLRAINNRLVYVVDVDRRQARELNRDAIELARRLGIRGALFTFLANEGWNSLLEGDVDRAIATFESGLEEDADYGDRMSLLGGRHLVGVIRGEDVSPLMAELERMASTMSDPRFADTHWIRAWPLFVEGRYGDASDEWVASAALSNDNATSSLLLATRAALWGRDRERSRATLAKLEGFPSHSPVVQVRQQVARAGIAAMEGRTAESLALYRAALRAWDASEDAFELALTGLDMAVLLDPTHPEVRATAERSREILTRMRAEPLLERLDSALRRMPDVSGRAEVRA